MQIEMLLQHGHQILLNSIEGIPATEWETAGTCGIWSARDVVGHVAAMEYFLEEVLTTFLGGGENPYMQGMGALGPDKFLEGQVAIRKNSPFQMLLEEYQEVYKRALALVPQISPETMRQPGTLPWYGAPYALEDFIVYSNYAHKREHSAQLAILRDRARPISI